MRHLPRALIFLPVVLLLAACQPAPPEASRVVAVGGEGELSVAPEIAIVQLGIEARAKEVSAAQADAGQVVEKTLAMIDALGVPADRVSSSQLRVEPEFNWQDGRQELRGYLVQREIRVELAELDQLGPLMERAMRAGVNRVAPPELHVREPRELHREALRLAAADARRNAEAIATSLGSEIGRVNRIDVHETGGPVPKMEMMRADASGGAEATYVPGRITVRASVRAEFELR